MGKTKICSVCKKDKAVELFSKSSRDKDGLQHKCKECAKDMYAEYIKKPKLKVQEKECNKCNVIKSIKNFSKDISKKDGHRPFCKECETNRVSKYYKENKEALKNYQKEYYEENKEYILKRNSEWQNENIEKIREYNKLYYKHNADHIKTKTKEYLRTPKGRAVDRASYHKREALKKQSISTMTARDWNNVFAHFDYACAYCGSQVDIQQDHVVPLSRGGHYTTQNIIPACKGCNSSKRANDMEYWYRTQDFFKKDRLEKINKWTNTTNNIQQLSIL